MKCEKIAAVTPDQGDGPERWDEGTPTHRSATSGRPGQASWRVREGGRPEGGRSTRAGIALLQRLCGVLSKHCVGQMPQVLDLGGLEPGSRRFVEETLGEGEVSILSRGLEEARIQETALPGVWLLHIADAGGRALRHVIEVADVPGLVRATAFVGARISLSTLTVLPEGVMNAPAVLTELEARAAAWESGQPAHIVNLTLLPQTEEDLTFLGALLGRGPVSILTRGYGNCRITATELQYVWWVQHFSAEDRLILNTLEVTDVPVAALAAQEDIEDSRDRLGRKLSELG